MSDIRKFIISSDVFGGFETMVNINSVNSLEEIINQVKYHLLSVLNMYIFERLIENYTERIEEFHIHNYTIEDIKNSSSIQIFWVCDHC